MIERAPNPSSQPSESQGIHRPDYPDRPPQIRREVWEVARRLTNEFGVNLPPHLQVPTWASYDCLADPDAYDTHRQLPLKKSDKNV